MGRSLDLTKVDIENIILPFKTYYNVVIAALFTQHTALRECVAHAGHGTVDRC
jgi:hypothetical protein